jgi:uncharacterized protein (TIGR00251 family)
MKASGRAEAALLRVRVQPRASRNSIVGFDQDTLKVRVTAPPADGEANAALLFLLAEQFGCPRSALTLVRGQHSREKLVRVSGRSLQEIRDRLSSNG